MDFAIIHGDCLEVMDMIPSGSVDSVVTDPPYGLDFMGKDWDHGVPGVPFWQQALRVAKPGAWLLAAGGTRTFHRLVVAVEDAGWEIRDTVLWAYGSGFPKSLDVSKAIDKAAGVERETAYVPNGKNQDYGKGMGSGAWNAPSSPPVTEAAKQWEGWGTALKPAFEPWVLARKPLEGTVAANVQAYGTGALNIDGCRVPTGDDTTTRHNSSSSYMTGKIGEEQEKQEVYVTGSSKGRWPANLIHDGSEEVVGLFPVTKSGKMGPKNTCHTDGSPSGIYGRFDVRHPLGETIGDSGSAARFFYVPKASVADREDGLRDGGVGALRDSGRENIKLRFNFHPTVKPTELMRYLCRLVTPPGGLVLDPFVGSGSTGRGAVLEGFRFIGIEKEQAYVEIAKKRIEAARATAVTG